MKSNDPKYMMCWLAKKYCAEDISLIENYAAMMADNTQKWCCHHRRETDENKSRTSLLEEGRYYHVPARELIFLTSSDHMSLHSKGVPLSEEHRQHLSEAMNRPDTKKRHSEATKAATKAAMSRPEVKKRLSEAMKGLKWWNNGTKTVRAKECPGEGFMPGRKPVI